MKHERDISVERMADHGTCLAPRSTVVDRYWSAALYLQSGITSALNGAGVFDACRRPRGTNEATAERRW